MRNIINLEQFDRKLFDFAYRFLTEKEGVTPETIDKHIYPNYSKKLSDLSDLYKSILESAQNTQMKKNVINRSMDNEIDSLSEILFDFKPDLVKAKYNLNHDLLLKDIKQKVRPNGKVRTTKRSIWYRFSQTIVSGAIFLTKFNDLDEFIGWVNKFDTDVISRAGLACAIGKEIDGFSFALSCDFLKDIGYTKFGKPDVHLINIFFELNMVEKKDDYKVFCVIDRIARNKNLEPYTVDKLFWLVGSGRFYLEENLFTGRNRDEFINKVKSEFSQYY